MTPAMHARIGDDQTPPALGLFGKNLGAMTPMAIIMLHLGYEAAVGVIA
jgi:hypothetical protein